MSHYFSYDNNKHKHNIYAIESIDLQSKLNYYPIVDRYDAISYGSIDSFSKRIFDFRFKKFDSEKECRDFAINFMTNLNLPIGSDPSDKIWIGQKQSTDINCMMTCIANYFGKKISEVPKIELLFESEPKGFWYDALQTYIISLGFQLNSTYIESVAIEYSYDSIYFCIGKTKRSGHLHQVICSNGEFIFDPHPDNSFLTDKICFEYLTPLKS